MYRFLFKNMNNEILKYAIENGIIDLNQVQSQIEMRERENYLKKHPYEIWCGNDGNWHTYFPDPINGRTQKKRKQRKDLEEDIIKYWKQEEENPTIREIFTEWNDRRMQLGKISSATHKRNEQFFDRHYTKFGDRRIKTVDAEDIEDFLDEQISEHNLTAKSFSGLKSITKGFLIRAKKQKFINFNVKEMFDDMDLSDTVFRTTIKEDYEEVFDDAETTRIIEYLMDNFDVQNAAIMLTFITGLRVGELVALKHEDFEQNEVKIRRTETRITDENNKTIYSIKEYPKTKSGIRSVVIPKDYEGIVQKIRRLSPFTDFVFCIDGQRITTNSVRRRLERVCKKLHIYQKSPHKIRKTYGTILLDNNVDKRLVAELMGHSDIKVTEDHYHRNRRSIDEKARIVSSIPDFMTKAK